MHKRGWIWYFAGLLALAAIAIGTPLILNLRQQLRPEQVAGARALWRERGPRDYELDYVERIDVDARGDQYHVAVRNGKATAGRINGANTAEPVLTIDDMFEYIEKTLAEDRAAGHRNYTIAAFDADDGHPRHYVRRVRGSQERLEWRVRLKAVEAAK